MLAAGCGAAAHGKFPVVVAHPKVQGNGVPSAGATGAMLLSPTRLAVNTTGTTSCVWWPGRLTVLDASTIRIDMRINGRVAGCGSGGASFPIAVTIPRVIDVHSPLTVLMEYKVRLPGTTRARESHHTVVAPALSG